MLSTFFSKWLYFAFPPAINEFLLLHTVSIWSFWWVFSAISLFFSLHFLDDIQCGNLFICLLAICLSHLDRRQFRHFALFLIGMFLLIVEFSVFWWLLSFIFLIYVFCIHFFLICFFSTLTVFNRTKSFNKIQFINFLRSLHQIQSHTRFYLIVFSRSFVVVHFIFRSMIHFELI